MSQELMLDGDHEEMVANWIAESVECEDCHGEGCEGCDGLGRIALCDLTQGPGSVMTHENCSDWGGD